MRASGRPVTASARMRGRVQKSQEVQTLVQRGTTTRAAAWAYAALLLAITVLPSCDRPLTSEPGAHSATETLFATQSAGASTATARAPDPTPSSTPQPSATSTHTATLTPSLAPATLTAAPSPTPGPTSTPASLPDPTATPTVEPPTATPGPTPSPEPTATALPTAAVHPHVPPLVLANYFPWYDPRTWDTGCTSTDDRPREGVYNSDEEAVISRHIGQAQSASLSGLAVHWFAPGDRTDHNLRKLLDRSPEGFNSTVTFLYHILPGVTQQGVIEALRYVMGTYGDHSRLLRVAGRALIFFSDMYRVPDGAGNRPASDQDVATAVARWAEIRAAVDPDRSSWWVAEGERPEYLQVFDGLYVYKIDHACCPETYRKAPRWAAMVRDWEAQTGQPKLWVGTVMPGWDDLNSAQAHCADLRVSSEPFARDRADGAYYAQTWEAVLPTAPDLILVHSFNEWVEGSYIEPSHRFGDRYLQLTAEWVGRFRASR